MQSASYNHSCLKKKKKKKKKNRIFCFFQKPKTPRNHPQTHAQIRVVRCVPAATLLAGWVGLFLVPASLVDPPQPGRPIPTRRCRRRHSHSHRRQNPATHVCQPERPGLRRTVPPTQKEMDPAPTA
jgi:hypothetical protein